MTPLWGSLVQVPLPVPDYCSKHILVMEYLSGVRLVDGLRNQYRRVAEHLGVTLEELEEERKEAIRNRSYKYKSLEDASSESKYLSWMDTFYDLVYTANPWKRLYNNTIPPLTYVATLGFASAPSLTVESRPVPLDLGATMSLLFAIHGHEIFEGGHFNGDPRKIPRLLHFFIY